MTARVALLTEIQSTAIHEAGHAIVVHALGLDVQLIALWEARGGFEGVVDYLHGESSIFDNVAIVCAGRAAISIIDPACSFELFAADRPWPPCPTPPADMSGLLLFQPGSRSPSFEQLRNEAVQFNPDPPLPQVGLSDFQKAHALIDRLEPAPSGSKHRMRILSAQWTRSREILRPRLSDVATLADALLNAYAAAEQRAFTPGGPIRVEISGGKLTRLLAFAK